MSPDIGNTNITETDFLDTEYISHLNVLLKVFIQAATKHEERGWFCLRSTKEGMAEVWRSRCLEEKVIWRLQLLAWLDFFLSEVIGDLYIVKWPAFQEAHIQEMTSLA